LLFEEVFLFGETEFLNIFFIFGLMARHIRWDESVLENALSLLEALLQLSEHQPEDLKLPLIAKWENDKLRITGFETKKNNAKASRTVEVGTKKEYLLKQIQEAGKTLKCPKHKELEEIQTVLDLLLELGVRQDNKSAKNQGYWKFAIALKHQTATVKENLEVVKHKWKEHSKTNPRKSSFTTQTASNSINWRHICGEMLNKHKRLTTDELLYTHEDMKFQFDDIHVPLALVQRTKPDKRQENITPEFGSQLLQPVEYEERQKLQHDDFLEKVLKQGIGKTQGKRIALIGEPGAGKTTLLQTIAFWIIEKNLGLPIWISLADLQLQNGSFQNFDEYLRESWLPKAVSNLTPATKSDFISSFESGQVWLLLDGVDEIVGGTNSPLQVISSQLDGWIAKSRVVVTCRLNIWEANLNALSDFETFRLLDLDYPSQVKQFIDNWFHLRKLTAQTAFQNEERSKKVEELWQELNKPEHQRVQDLIKNPLLLVLFCATWQSSEKGLPDTKVGFYHLFVKQFYNWKSNRFRTTEKRRRELNVALGDLAKQALDEESSRFRLHHEFISNLLGDSEEKGSLFWLALQLGWLNKVGIAAESDTQEEVYAFYHPTFQEYFAALGVDDWDFFLPREHKDKPVKDQDKPSQHRRYRVFEPQWKQVILLWMGRDKNQILDKQKDKFIKALLEFSDGFGNKFYSYQAHFIAAEGIANYINSIFTNQILEYLIKLGFGYFNYKKRKWIRFNHKIAQGARLALQHINRKLAANAIIAILPTIKDEIVLWQAIEVLIKVDKSNPELPKFLLALGKIARKESIRVYAIVGLLQIDNENLNAIKCLFKIAQNSKNSSTRLLAATKLLEISNNSSKILPYVIQLAQNSEDTELAQIAKTYLKQNFKGNQEVQATVIQGVTTKSYNYIPQVKADSLDKIENSSLKELLQLLEINQDDFIRRRATAKLGIIAKDKPQVCDVLMRLMQTDRDNSIRWRAADSLIEIDNTNIEAIQTLILLVQNFEEPFIHWQVIMSLGKISCGNSTAINVLMNILLKTADKFISRYAIQSIAQIASRGDLEAISALIRIIEKSEDKFKISEVLYSWEKHIKTFGLELAVSSLKLSLVNQNQIQTVSRHTASYDMMWHYSQNTTYPAFYQAWHQE
jgi:predicted NACHT family NTPase